MTRTANLVALIRDDMTTVKCKFEDFGKHYTFKCPLPLASHLSGGDAVLVRSRNEIQIVTVVEVDVEPDIDAEAQYDYKWVFDRVRTEVLDTLEDEDRKLADRLSGMRRRHLRAQTMQALGLDPNHSTRQLLDDQVAKQKPTHQSCWKDAE